MVNSASEREELEARIAAIYEGRSERGYVLVMDEHGWMDFARGTTVVQVRDALLSLARDLATYRGD